MADRPINYRINFDRGRTSGADDVRRIRSEADGLEKDLRQATRAADRLDGSLSKAARGADFGRTGGGLERVLGAAVGGGSQEILGLAGDIADVVEGLTGDPAGLKGALKGLISPAGLLSVGLAAVGVGFTVLDGILKEAAESANAASEAYITAREIQRTVRDDQLTTTQIQEKLNDARKREADALANIAGQSEILNGTFEESQRQFGDLGARIGFFAASLGGSFNTLNTDVEQSNAALIKARAEIKAYEAALQGQTVASNDAFDAVKQLVGDGLNLLSDGSSKAEAALGELGDTLEEGAEEFKKFNEAAEKAFTDFQSSVQSAVDKLDADGTKLGDALRNTIADLNAELVSAQQDAANDIAEARADAAAAELEAVTTFQRDQARAQRDFEREQKRIRDDARRSELDAIEANDIQALLNVREEAQVQLKENRQRFKAEQADRQADFEARRAAEQTALAETIAGIIQQRDAEIASINARIVAEHASFDAQIAEINRLKEAQIAQVDAVIAANERKTSAELAAVDAVANRWEALVLYQNGQLYQINPALKNSPPTLGSVLAVPPPPVDPFGIGNFFNSPPQSSGPEGALSMPPVQITMPPGAVIVGDLASKEDVFSTVYDAVRAAAAALYQARTGVSA